MPAKKLTAPFGKDRFPKNFGKNSNTQKEFKKRKGKYFTGITFKKWGFVELLFIEKTINK